MLWNHAEAEGLLYLCVSSHNEVFHNLPLSVISVIFLYYLMFSIFWFWTYRTNLAHRKQEQEKDENIKKNF